MRRRCRAERREHGHDAGDPQPVGVGNVKRENGHWGAGGEVVAGSQQLAMEPGEGEQRGDDGNHTHRDHGADGHVERSLHPLDCEQEPRERSESGRRDGQSQPQGPGGDIACLDLQRGERGQEGAEGHERREAPGRLAPCEDPPVQCQTEQYRCARCEHEKHCVHPVFPCSPEPTSDAGGVRDAHKGRAKEENKPPKRPISLQDREL